MDIRFLLIGSLLPDIIDKPVGLIILRDTINNGRIFAHTLLFLVLLTLTASYFYRRYHDTRLLAFSLGTFTHLILDRMWRTPRTLFWPVFGLTFEKLEFTFTSWISYILHNLTTYPHVLIPELIGAAIVIWFTWILIRRKGIGIFIRYGKVR